MRRHSVERAVRREGAGAGGSSRHADPTLHCTAHLQVAFVGLTFTALQSASLCLVTTPPERMAAALGVALTPLRALGVPVREMVLTLLLALRFMNTVRACGWVLLCALWCAWRGARPATSCKDG